MIKDGTDLRTLFELDDPTEYRSEQVEGGIRIVGYTGSKQFLEIPETINGQAVVELGDSKNHSFSSVMPTILMPKTVCRFDPDAFCDSYKYSNRIWFGGIVVPEEHPFFRLEDGILYSKDMKTLYFCFSRNLKQFIMPDSVEVVKKGAFRYLDSPRLQFGQIALSKNLKTIEAFAFQNCEGNARGKFSLPEGIERLGYLSLGNISCVLPSTVKVLEGIPCPNFELSNDSYVSQLGVVYTADMSKAVGYSKAVAYNNSDTSVKSLAFDEKTEEILPYAFSNLERLEKLELGQSVKRIGKMAFSSARIKTIRIPEQVEEIDDTSFGYDRCNSIVVDKKNSHFYTDKVCLYRVNEDGSKALMKCFKPLEDYTIPEGVVSICISAFSGCATLKSLKLPSTLTEFDGTCIKDTSIEEIIIPKSVRKLSCIKGSKTVRYLISDDNPFLLIDNSVLYERNGEAFRAIDMIPDKKAIVICPNTTEIADGAFSNLRGVTSVTIPESVKRIGCEAFLGCGIRSIKLPDSLEVIDDNAFSECKLTSIQMPDNLKYVCRTAFDEAPIISYEIKNNTRYTTVDGSLFTADMKTLLAVPYSEVEKNYAIPDTVEHIGQVFNGKKYYSSVSLSDCIKALPYRAMENGPKKLSGGKGLVYIDDGCFSPYSFYLDSLDLDITSYPESALIDYANKLRDRGNKAIRITVLGFEKFQNLSDQFELVPHETGVSIVSLKVFPTDLTIPDVVGGYKVTGMSSGAFKDAVFHKVVFTSPDSVNFEAIKKCSIEEIVLPEGITELPESAFASRRTLTSITIPKSLKKIGSFAFQYCNNLKTITLNEGLETIGQGAFYSCENIESISVPGTVRQISKSAFQYCKSLKTVTIEEGTESIEEAAFFGCGKLEVLSVPASVTHISEYIFADNNQKYKDLYLNSGTLYAVVPGSYAEAFFRSYSIGDTDSNKVLKVMDAGLSTSATEIEVFNSFDYELLADGSVQVSLKSSSEENAIVIPARISGKPVSTVCFPNRICPNTKTIHLPESVVELRGIKEDTFFSYSKIEIAGIEVDQRNTSFATDGHALYSKDYKRLIHFFSYDMERYVIPEGVETICEFAFAWQLSLVEISLPQSIRLIDSSAFARCRSLAVVSGIESAQDVAANAFDETPYLRNLPIAIIGTVFKGYHEKGQVSYQIPEGITEIDSGAFSSDAATLEQLIFPSTLQVIKDKAFSGDTSFKVKEISIPEGVKSIPEKLFINFGSLTRIELPSTLQEFPVNSLPQPGWQRTVALTEINVAANNQSYRSIDGILFSADGSVLLRFPCCHPATSYKIPDGVEIIGKNAFSDCKNLQAISFPDTLQSIEEEAFSNCGIISAQLKCKAIGKRSFYCSGLTSVTLNETETIGEEAFCGCKFNAVTLPKTVMEIGANAFGGCPAGTPDITIFDSYPGQMALIATGPRHPLRNYPVTVKSAESDEIKFAIWSTTGSTYSGSDTLKKCWKKGTEYDFALLDNSFKVIDGTDNKLRVAFLRLRYPIDLTESAKKNYTSYVNRNIALLLQMCTDLGDVEAIKFLSDSNLIKPAHLDSAIEYAVSQNSVSVTALLMDLKNSKPGKKSKAPDPVFDLSETAPSLWSFNKKGSTLLGRYKGNESELVLPKEIDGIKVTGLAATTSKVPENYLSITSVVVPEGYTTIGACAFYGCENLETITLPSTLEEIGKSAFENCKKLKEIVLPEGIKTIEIRTFKDCASLSKVVFPNTLESIYEMAFNGCKALTEVEFPRRCNKLLKDCFAFSGVKKAVFHAKKVSTTGITFMEGYGRYPTVFFAYKDALKGCYNISPYNTVTIRIANTIGDAAISIVFEDNKGESLEESFFIEKTSETLLNSNKSSIKASIEQAATNSDLVGCLDSLWGGALKSSEIGQHAMDKLCAFCGPEKITKIAIREEKHCVDGISVATMTWNSSSRSVSLEVVEEFVEDQRINTDLSRKQNSPNNTYSSYHNYFDYFTDDSSSEAKE